MEAAADHRREGAIDDCWVEDWNAELKRCTSVGRLTRDVRRQERTDLRNRFLSIDMDAKFVSDLVAAYRRAGCAYPVFANLRNGLWYGKDWDGTCYFKSTDGHSGRWAFSYTRLNMHLAAAAAASGGCIVVDSTRAGKRFPDSLTATVPIWCCLLNRLAAAGNGEDGSLNGGRSCEEVARSKEGCEGNGWDTALHTPRWLSASEASQIEERIPGWIQGLGDARGPLTTRLRSFLRKPLRAVWLNPESRLVDGMIPASPTAGLSFTPVVCVSASKFWANSERLVGLANGGDRSAFEAATTALMARTKKAVSAAPPAPAGVSADDGGAHPRRGVGESAGRNSDPRSAEGAKGHRGMEEDPWQPGGPDLHAVLCSTGLIVGSLAYAADNWASQGENCSLLNLSDQAFPEKLAKATAGPSRRYLHIPLKEGKKANPPRYWQTKVFPAALSFIAAAIGRAPSREHEEVPASSQAQDRLDGRRPSPGCKRASTAQPSAVSAAAGDESASEGDKQEDGTTSGGGDLPSRMERMAVAAVPEESRSCATRACSSEPPAGQADNAQFRLARRRQQEQRHQHHQQQRRQSREGVVGMTGAPRRKCLVVCPTGAEASVIVCLCALVAFFPPSSTTTGATNRTASAGDRDQPHQSSPLSSAKALTAGETADDGDVGQYFGGGSFSLLRRRSAPAETSAATTADVAVTKAQLRWRFLLVQQECPWARPPRRLMQELNEYFMTPGEHSWWTLSDRLSEESVGFDRGGDD
eukprot:g4357.t3